MLVRSPVRIWFPQIKTVGDFSQRSRFAPARWWHSGVQQLFQCDGAGGPDTGNRCQGGGVSAQQVVQAAKSRTDSARGDGTYARQRQQDLHLLLGLSSPVSPCRGAVSRLVNANMHFSDLALFCCRIDQQEVTVF